jgi:hypothetical protein
VLLLGGDVGGELEFLAPGSWSHSYFNA